jgi:3-methyladenine DNA glycosylase AlkD
VSARTPPAVTPERLLADARAALRAAADPVRAEGMRRYFRKFAPVRFYGVAVPGVRALARRLYGRVRGEWSVREALRFAELALREREMEAKHTGLFLLARFAADFPLTLDRPVRRWILAGRLTDWAVIDALSGEVLARWLDRYPARLVALSGWRASPNLWLRRASVVPLTRFAHRGEHLDEVYAAVASLLDDREDMVHKACGWVLREAGTTDPARLERFLLRHGPRIPRTTLRYAIERFAPSERRRLLAETRPAR